MIQPMMVKTMVLLFVLLFGDVQLYLAVSLL